MTSSKTFAAIAVLRRFARRNCRQPNARKHRRIALPKPPRPYILLNRQSKARVRVCFCMNLPCKLCLIEAIFARPIFSAKKVFDGELSTQFLRRTDICNNQFAIKIRQQVEKHSQVSVR